MVRSKEDLTKHRKEGKKEKEYALSNLCYVSPISPFFVAIYHYSQPLDIILITSFTVTETYIMDEHLGDES